MSGSKNSLPRINQMAPIAWNRTLIHRLRLLLLTTMLIVVAGLGHEADSAGSQIYPAESAYATDRVIVKPEDGISPESKTIVSRVQKANTMDTIEILPLSEAWVIGLPSEISVHEAVRIFEAVPGIEYAQPDYLIKVEQTDPTFEEDSGPINTESIDPAPYEEPPADPPAERLMTLPRSQTPGSTPVIPNDPRFDELWALDNFGQTGGEYDADIDAPEAWNVTEGGADTIVAVLDDGVDINHPDLNDNVWVNEDEIPNNGKDDDNNKYIDDVNGWDFLNDDNTVYDAEDPRQHGTRVAGIIGAEGNNGEGIAGVSWKSKVMPLKFIGAGDEHISDVAEALRYAVANGAGIANNSWGCEGLCPDSPILETAIAEANTAGILFVASAGNESRNTDINKHYPSGYDFPNIISVGATDDTDYLTSLSNRGVESVDLAAPGQTILSTLPGGAYGIDTNASVGRGTSMSAAYVSGVAALIKSEFPNMTHLEIKDRILESAEKKEQLSGLTATGGRLNAAAALGLGLTEISLEEPVPFLLTFGQSTSLSGRLTSFGQPLAGKQVILEKRQAGEEDYVALSPAAETGPDGSFTYGPSYPQRNTDYRARFIGEAETGLKPAISSSVRADVRAIVTLSAATTDMQFGRARTIAGVVKPHHQGPEKITLTIRRAYNGVVRTVLVKKLGLNTNSRYAFTYKPPTPGIYIFKAHYEGDLDQAENDSVTKHFRVVR